MEEFYPRPQDGTSLALDKKREEKANGFNIETKRRKR
jgi:hypothetical protein